MIRRALKAAKTAFYENIYAAWATLPSARPTISFTFDDVPYSAMQNGAPILERNGIEGTFYLAATFAVDSAAREHTHLTADNARALRAAGHHLGCHTYSHRSLKSWSSKDCFLDAERNRSFWQQELGSPLEDFSYPFGDVTVGGKRALRGCYRSLRGNRRGINRLRTDMACLRAVSLYSASFNRDEIQALIDDCAANGGWLIFYTHGVDLKPDSFDITPDDFRWVVERCRDSSAQILSVERARRHLLMERMAE
jgi:peptidoglycan/xylan/chitin deacetylase (PgdA/CDA1 family)